MVNIVNAVLGDARGGRWEVVCAYTRLLLARGHRVRLLLRPESGADPDLIPPGAEVCSIRCHGHYDYAAVWRLRRHWKSDAPDLAIAHCSRSVALLTRVLKYRSPVLAVTHSNKVQRLLAADACVALTADIAQRVADLQPAHPCFVVPNMLPLDRDSPPLRIPHRPVRLAALGRFDPVKGFDVFIEALGRLKRQGFPFSAVLAGEGPQQAALERQARGLGLTPDELRFSGWVKGVDRFLAEVDVLCVPARADAFGLTPLRAARAGVPMVLSRASGHRQMFAPGTEALFADTGDAGQTASQLARLADDPALAERLRQSAFRRFVAQYSTQAVGDRLAEIIDKIIYNRQH